MNAERLFELAHIEGVEVVIFIGLSNAQNPQSVSDSTGEPDVQDSIQVHTTVKLKASMGFQQMALLCI